MKNNAKRLEVLFIITILIVLGINNIVYATYFSDLETGGSKGYADTEQNEDTTQKSNVTLTTPEVEDPEGKSSNNYLKSLTISGADLTPKFDKQTIKYEAHFNGEDITTKNQIEILAEADDDRAIVQGIGIRQLNPGENKLDVIVTAENGGARVYSITVKTPLKQSKLRLSKLDIKSIDSSGQYEKINLEPTFNSEIFSYTCEVGKDVTSLNITPEADSDNVSVEIKGQDTIIEGENSVTITLKSQENGEEIKTVYTVKVTKKAAENTNNSNMTIWIIIAIAFVIIIGILIIEKKKNSKKLNTKNGK